MITLNGEPLDFGGTVADLVEHRFGDRCRSGIAVAIDQEVVPRSRWESRRLAAGERVELVTAVQGG
jgi:sulfur carrier protein